MRILPALTFIVAPMLMQASEKFDFPHSYVPEALPQKSVPKWSGKVQESAGRAEIRDGALQVEVFPNNKIGWRVGVISPGEERDSSDSWHADPTKSSTIDITINVDSDSSAEVFRLNFANGEGFWAIQFFTDGILIPKYREGKIFHNTREKDTYRVVITENGLSLYSAKKGVLAEGILSLQGSDMARRNYLSFGTLIPCVAPVRWSLYSLRWTNDAALEEPPLPE